MIYMALIIGLGTRSQRLPFRPQDLLGFFFRSPNYFFLFPSFGNYGENVNGPNIYGNWNIVPSFHSHLSLSSRGTVTLLPSIHNQNQKSQGLLP